MYLDNHLQANYIYRDIPNWAVGESQTGVCCDQVAESGFGQADPSQRQPIAVVKPETDALQSTSEDRPTKHQRIGRTYSDAPRPAHKTPHETTE